MSQTRKPWSSVRSQLRKESFIGRADQLKVFSDNFSGDPIYMLFAVTGEGGVGKSTLLEQYTDIARSPKVRALVIRCDEKQSSPVEAMGYIAEELAKHSIKHEEFDDRYKKYREVRQEAESDPKTPRTGLNLVARGISDLAINSLRSGTRRDTVPREHGRESSRGRAGRVH